LFFFSFSLLNQYPDQQISVSFRSDGSSSVRSHLRFFLMFLLVTYLASSHLHGHLELIYRSTTKNFTSPVVYVACGRIHLHLPPLTKQGMASRSLSVLNMRLRDETNNVSVGITCFIVCNAWPFQEADRLELKPSLSLGASYCSTLDTTFVFYSPKSVARVFAACYILCHRSE